MKWKRGSGRDVIDVRGNKGGRGSGGGGLSIPTNLASLGGSGLLVVIAIIAFNVLSGGGGFDLSNSLNATAPGANNPQPPPPGQDPQADLKDFSSYVFGDAQDIWEGIFDSDGAGYERAKLVLFSNNVSTGGCGAASSAVGPFYCPADKRVYIDLTFYEEMERELGASGDFAWAYVITHEVGHHVQNELGTSDEVDALSRNNEGSRNELSVRQELQADCYAGVWGATVFEQGDLEDGDLDEAFGAAEAVGDDRLQERGGRTSNPETFTHGTSAQRRTWFKAGYESGEPGRCDTFSVDEV